MTELPINVLRYVELPTDRAPSFAGAEQAALDRITTKIGGRGSPVDVLAFLAEALHGISPCDRFSLAFVEEGQRRVVSRFTHAFYEPLILQTGYAEDLTDSSLKTVIERGVPRIINDLEAYLAARPRSRSTRALLEEGVRASLTCPLQVDGRNVGLLFRSARQPHAYNDHQVHLHLAVAERLSQVVEKVYRIDRLAEANRAYFEMLGFVTHELKSPIASMLTEAGLIRDGYLGEITPPQRERIEKLISKGRYLLGLVGDYLQLSRMEGGDLQMNPRRDVDFATEVCEPALDVIASQADAQDTEVALCIPDDLAGVELDPQLLKIVLVNLLSNAVKYGREGGEIRLHVSREDTRLHVAVWNRGPGFPPSARNKLFRRFSRIDTPELMQRKGTGVGLYTAWRIVTQHGGRMDARSEPGQWAEFSFEIPQPLPPEVSSP